MSGTLPKTGEKRGVCEDQHVAPGQVLRTPYACIPLRTSGAPGLSRDFWWGILKSAHTKWPHIGTLGSTVDQEQMPSNSKSMGGGGW